MSAAFLYGAFAGALCLIPISALPSDAAAHT